MTDRYHTIQFVLDSARNSCEFIDVAWFKKVLKMYKYDVPEPLLMALAREYPEDLKDACENQLRIQRDRVETDRVVSNFKYDQWVMKCKEGNARVAEERRRARDLNNATNDQVDIWEDRIEEFINKRYEDMCRFLQKI